MRIVAGKWAGRDLVSPAGRVRPTAESLRDRWLSLLEPDLAGATVIDLYAGSGALGLEALSRGAASVDFVENGASALHALKANIAALRAKPKTRLFKRDALRFVSRIEAGRYDIALADPPYGSRQADRLVEQWLARPFSRILAIEHAADARLPGRGRTRLFDGSAVTVYRAEPTRPAGGGRKRVRRPPDSSG